MNKYLSGVVLVIASKSVSGLKTYLPPTPIAPEPVQQSLLSMAWFQISIFVLICAITFFVIVKVINKPKNPFVEFIKHNQHLFSDDDIMKHLLASGYSKTDVRKSFAEWYELKNKKRKP
jgi:hypothetical protein